MCFLASDFCLGEFCFQFKFFFNFDFQMHKIHLKALLSKFCFLEIVV